MELWTKEYRHSLFKMLEREKMKRFVNVEPCYTGGGIYCFVGEFADGTYFIASDADYDTRIVNAKTYIDDDDTWDYNWQEEHLIKDLTPDESLAFFKSMLNWIIEHKPQGNYAMDEIEDTLEEVKKLESEENWR